MSHSVRWRALGLTFASMVVLGGLPLAAQQDTTGKEATKPAARKKADPARRVPDHFGQIGLSDEQRESIYKIRASYQGKIDDLRRQLAEVDARMLQECETVLSSAQKELLASHRKAAAEAARARAAAAREKAAARKKAQAKETAASSSN